MHKNIGVMFLVIFISIVLISCDDGGSSSGADTDDDGNDTAEDNFTATALINACSYPVCEQPAIELNNTDCSTSGLSSGGFAWKYPAESSRLAIILGDISSIRSAKACLDPLCEDPSLNFEFSNIVTGTEYGTVIRLNDEVYSLPQQVYFVLEFEDGRTAYWYICNTLQRWDSGRYARDDLGGCRIEGPYIASCN